MNDTFIYTLFNKQIHQLELNDIISFFKNEKIETDKLEFKSYTDFENSTATKSMRDKEKLNDIFKSLCAFLNSDGGVLIWGAPEGKNVEGLKERAYFGDITPVKYKLEKDQFINRVSSDISPTPHRILFHSIAIGENSYCYIIEVIKSEFAPHQHKGTYYIRLDGSTRPAPHHYVEALIKKISFPKLEVYMSFGETVNGKNFAAVPIVLTIHNISKYLHEKNVEYRILSDRGLISNPNRILNYENFLDGCDIEKKVKPVLHYNMPYVEDLVLVTKKIFPRENALHANILISVWGELSPVIVSNYRLEFYGDIRDVKTRYLMREKKENFYLYEKSEEFVGEDKIATSHSLMLKSFEERFPTFPVFKQL